MGKDNKVHEVGLMQYKDIGAELDTLEERALRRAHTEDDRRKIKLHYLIERLRIALADAAERESRHAPAV